jgi:hypothetical protein
VTFRATGGSYGNPTVYKCGTGGQVDFGDVDGDGDLDMLQGNHSNAIRVYANNGAAGNFTDAGAAGLGKPVGLGTIVARDFNGDTLEPHALESASCSTSPASTTTAASARISVKRSERAPQPESHALATSTCPTFSAALRFFVFIPRTLID